MTVSRGVRSTGRRVTAGSPALGVAYPSFVEMATATIARIRRLHITPSPGFNDKAAPCRRNDVLLNFLPKGLVAFPGSGITNNSIDKARKIGIPVLLVMRTRFTETFCLGVVTALASEVARRKLSFAQNLIVADQQRCDHRKLGTRRHNGPFAGLTGAQARQAEHPNSNETWADMSRERWKSIGAHAVGLWETASRGATYNPLSAGIIQDPYKTYARLRRRSPCCFPV